MKKRTIYIAPISLDEALKILDNIMGETKVIAGGTDLIPRMRSGMATASRLLDIRKLSLFLRKCSGSNHGSVRIVSKDCGTVMPINQAIRNY
jgi:CO/xanthine dehydrogenase FAD-binding subunit